MLYPDFEELVALKGRATQLCLKSNRAVISTATGDNLSPFRGQGLEFEEVREYAPGDDVRNIDWRVTARTGKPHMKVFREEHERSVMLCVDVNEAMRFGTRGTFKSVQAARVAALLGWRAHMNHDRLGGCLFGSISKGVQFFAPKRSRKSFWAILKQLSDHNHLTDSKIVPVGDILMNINKAATTGSLIYVISDFSSLGESFALQIGKLRKRCDLVFITIDDAADQHIPPIGEVLFANDHTETVHINTNNGLGRKSYAHQWQETRTQLCQIASQFAIGLISLRTTDVVASQLTLGLKHLSKRTQVR